MTDTVRVFSFGGGVQSTAALVLASQGHIDFRTFVFANVGEDSENPGTLAYVAQVTKPFASEHGLDLVEVRRTLRGGATPSLLQNTLTNVRSIHIPMRTKDGRPGRRNCTTDYKRKVIAKYVTGRGATADNPAVVGLGISLDEVERARTDSGFPSQTLAYPLLDLRLSRSDCLRIIADAGLPQPPKSSCWFCPFHRLSDWKDQQRTAPDLFLQAVDLERTLSDRSQAIGRKAVFLSRRGVPLAQAFEGVQAELDEGIGCESGFCWT